MSLYRERRPERGSRLIISVTLPKTRLDLTGDRNDQSRGPAAQLSARDRVSELVSRSLHWGNW